MSLNQIAADLLSKLNEDPERLMLNLIARESGFDDWNDQKEQCRGLTPLKFTDQTTAPELTYAPALGHVKVTFYNVYDDTSGETFTVQAFVDAQNNVSI